MSMTISHSIANSVSQKYKNEKSTKPDTLNKTQEGYENVHQNKGKDELISGSNASDIQKSENNSTMGEKRLSSAARKVLSDLRSKNPEMEIFVADFDKGDNAKDILAGSTKEFSVFFSSKELEKMATDKKYYNEKISGVNGALRMSEQINQQFGFERAFGKNNNFTSHSIITKLGVSFDDDGELDIFAELEEITNNQKNLMDKVLEKRAGNDKTSAFSFSGKKTIIQAESQEDLLSQINLLDWNKVSGIPFDFSV